MYVLATRIRFMSRMSLRRLITLFVMVSMLLLFVALFCFYYSFYRTTVDNSYKYMDRVLTETEARLNVLLSDVSSSMLRLAYSERVYSTFINVPAVQKFETGHVIRTMLNNLAVSDPLISSIALRLKSGQTLLSDNLSGSLGQYLVLNAIVREYQLSEPFQKTLFTGSFQETGSDQVYYAFLVPIFNTTGGARSADRYMGAYIALCAARDLADMRFSGTYAEQTMIVISENDSLIYAHDFAWASELMKAMSESDAADGPIRVGRTLYQTRTGTITATGWKINCAVPDTELRSGLDKIRAWGVILTLSVIVVQLLMGYSLRRSIVRPLSSVVQQIHNVGTGNGPAEITVPDSSEIGILAEDISEMLERIDRMNSEIVAAAQALHKAETSRLEAQIMFLQAQINPHFLYNNLECIRGMAAASQMETVKQMATAIASVYRYCISSGQVVMLHQELKVIRQLFHIINLRYVNRYKMMLNVQKDILERPIPKMTLQPIFENALLHGLAGIDSGGVIVIEGHTGKDGETVLTVTDNGHGMNPEKIDAINTHLAGSLITSDNQRDDHRIGLINVNSRIRLIFGSQYGISLKKADPQGLCVIIRIGKEEKHGS